MFTIRHADVPTSINFLPSSRQGVAQASRQIGYIILKSFKLILELLATGYHNQDSNCVLGTILQDLEFVIYLNAGPTSGKFECPS